jgi:hypothetical protein
MPYSQLHLQQNASFFAGMKYPNSKVLQSPFENPKEKVIEGNIPRRCAYEELGLARTVPERSGGRTGTIEGLSRVLRQRNQVSDPWLLHWRHFVRAREENGKLRSGAVKFGVFLHGYPEKLKFLITVISIIDNQIDIMAI